MIYQSSIDPWLVEEYRYLVQEMIQNREKQAQIFLYALLGAGALLAFGANGYPELPSLVFLLPIVILAPAALMVVSLRQVIERIEAYLRIRIPSAQVNQAYTALIREFGWPGRGLRYVPLYKLMVYTNFYLCLACVALTWFLPLLSNASVDILAVALGVLALLPTVACPLYMFRADQICAPGRMERAWQATLGAYTADPSS